MAWFITGLPCCEPSIRREYVRRARSRSMLISLGVVSYDVLLL